MSWCCMFGRRSAMDIEYDNKGMTLTYIKTDSPMPDDETLNAMFTDLVDDLDLDVQHREAMFSLTSEKKWQIYCSKTKEMDNPNSISWPDYYIDRIKTMSAAQVFFAHNEEEMELRLNLINGLKTALRTKPMRFVIRFIEFNGLTCVLNFLEQMDHDTSQGAIHTSAIGCIKALMNNTQGRAHVLAHPNSINVISQSLTCDNIKTKTAVMEILGAICLVPGGHKKVLNAMLHYQQYACERTRFQKIINDLDRNTGAYQEDVNYKTAIMSFINASLKYGPGQDHLEFRLHLRYEYLMLGIQPVIENLRSHENAALDRHIDFFELVRNEDEREFAKVFDQTHIDTKSAGAMFEVLKKKIAFSSVYPHFTSLIKHLLLLTQVKSLSSPSTCYYWQLLDRILQQIVLQQRNSVNPDQEPLDLDFNQLVKQLANEGEMKIIQQKIKELYKEKDEVTSKLTKKERECEVKSQEKDELLATMGKMKARLERETSGHIEARQKLDELANQVNQLQQRVAVEHAERERLEKCVKTGNYPDDAKVDLTSTFSADILPVIAPPAPPLPGGPAPPAPPGVPGPPPPPGAPPIGGFGMSAKKKNIPKSTNPLKSFNWAKLPDTKLAGTIWSDVDEMTVYKSLDLCDLDRMFSAYQHHQSEDSDDSGYSTLTPCKPKPKELSVIDGRRAQNCTILLSRLKMTNEELSDAIWSMDKAEELPKDMCEQLLKFVPTSEEKQMLGEHDHEINDMARADRFLYDMSRIPHYEQRLEALFYKKKFTERVSECRPKIEAVLDASTQVLKSNRLQSLLEIVLALGNYMNCGARGNASGFKLTSLNKIIDTKSSTNRNITLLHFLTGTLQKKFPDLLMLDQDLAAVKEAAKVNLPELEKEVATLRVGLKNIEKELQYHRTNSQGNYHDKFVSAMDDFVTVAQYTFTELEDQLKEMKSAFSRAVKAFCEDPATAQPDQFFGIFNMFLTHFTEAHTENEKFKRLKEEEERRVEQEAKIKAEKEKQRQKRPKVEQKGEFDDLISALQTGDVFGDDIAKMKKTRRRPRQAKADILS